jgi:DegV family protein with EDD domain
MAGLAIVTDSTAYLSAEQVAAHRLHVIPLTVNFVDGSIEDGAVDLRAFFDRVERSDRLPVTSQPPPGKFIALYEQLIGEGKEIISIHLSSKMSGTYETACAAARMVDRSKISVIDSQQILASMGYQVLAAAQAAAEGLARKDVVELVKRVRSKVSFYFVPATLDYLRRGGRIGGAEALLGTLLQIKPVLYIREGQVEVLTKVRTWKRAVERILQEMPRDCRSLRIGVGHGLAGKEMLRIKEALEEQAPGASVDIWSLGAVIGLHVGPGAIGVAYWPQD